MPDDPTREQLMARYRDSAQDDPGRIVACRTHHSMVYWLAPDFDTLCLVALDYLRTMFVGEERLSFSFADMREDMGPLMPDVARDLVDSLPSEQLREQYTRKWRDYDQDCREFERELSAIALAERAVAESDPLLAFRAWRHWRGYSGSAGWEFEHARVLGKEEKP